MSEAVFNKLLRDLEAQILGTRQSGRTDRSNLIDSYCLLKLVVDGIDLKGGDLGASAGAYTIIKGVAGDGIADDTIAINTALQQAGQALNSKQVLGTAGKAIVFLPGGTYKISSTITVPTGITLRGETVVPPYPNRLSGFGSNFNMFTGTELVCTSNFVGSVAVDLSADNTSIENIILDGHSIPSGTCYTIIRATTAQNKRVDTGYLKFGVTDLSDFRQPKSIEIDTWEIPFFEVNKYFEYQLTAFGTTSSLTWSILNGTLPTGLTLSSSGLLSGIATQRANSSITFRVTDGTNTHDKVLPVGTVLDYIVTKDIIPLTVNSPYSFTLEKRNSSSTTWACVNLPSFLSLNASTGEITCPTPSQAIVGDYEIKVHLKDGTTIIDTRIFDFKCVFLDSGLRLYYEDNLSPQVNQPFSYQYRGYGGHNSYTWTIDTNRSTPDNTFSGFPTAASPCPGLTLNSTTGVLSGTPTTLGKATFFIRAVSTVNSNLFWVQKVTINIVTAGQTPKVHTRSIPFAVKNQSYSYQSNFESIPSAEPYTYSAVNLPTGLSINSSTGLISGTPVGSNFVQGIRLRWSTNVKNCSIRGFRSGAGMISDGASNVHRITGCLISVCDSGISSPTQTWDSHFSDLYIYNCRVGLDLKSGSAGLSFNLSRIEFIHENGIQMDFAHENDFNGLYFDTCGFNAIKISNCKNTIISACRFYRSGRNVRGPGNPYLSRAKSDLSSHVQILSSPRTTITGCSFDLGSDNAGDALYLDLSLNRESAKPQHCITFFDCPSLTINSNNLTGCVSHSLNFTGGTYKSEVIEDNNYSGEFFRPLDKEFIKNIYIPNANFQVWQRHTTFNIPPALTNISSTYEVADYWRLQRGGTSIDKPILVERRTGINFAGGNYLHMEKAVNTTTAPGDNYQFILLENIHCKDVALSNNRKVVLSFWARSNNETSVTPRLTQYSDSAGDAFAVNTFFGGRTKMTPLWKRYHFTFDLADYTGIVLGANNILNTGFLTDRWNEVIDLDITGVQIDFADKNPLPRELRVNNFSQELAEAQKYYQKSKPYNLFFSSWGSDNQKYANGTNWEEGWLQSYAPSTDGFTLTASVSFDSPLLAKPGNPTTNGTIDKVKLINPAFVTNFKTDISANKNKWNGTNNPAPYIEQISTTGMRLSARGATGVTVGQGYSIHWIISYYPQDL